MSNINDIVSYFNNDEFDKFVEAIEKNPKVLSDKFTDPDNSRKEITLLNFVLSFSDKKYFDVLLKHLNSDLINNALPESALFTGLKLTEKEPYFFKKLLEFKPNLLAKDAKANNLFSILASRPNISKEYVKVFMQLGINPFEENVFSESTAFDTAAYSSREDILLEIIEHTPNFNLITENNIKSLIQNQSHTVLKKLAESYDMSEILNSDFLFNFSCSERNVVALDLILEESSFFPGQTQLADLIDIMCDHYDTTVEKEASKNIAAYLFSLKLPFDKFTNNSDQNAWELAIRNDNKEVFELLVNSPSTLNFQDKDLLSPLMYAVQEENLDFVEKIVAKKPYLVTKDKAGNTALIMAVKRRAEDIVAFLAKQPNVGVNEVNQFRETALNLAVRMKNIPMVNSLIWSGADISLYPYTSLSVNPIYGFDNDNTFTVLHEEEDIKTIDNFNAMIAYGFNINQVNSKGDNLLNHFIKNGYIQNFKSIVRCRIDYEFPDADGNTPIMNAFLKDEDDYAIHLLQFSHHLDFNHKNNNGETVYDYAKSCLSARRVANLLLSDSELTKEKVSSVLPILAIDANFNSIDNIHPFVDFNFIDEHGNDLLMLSVLGRNEENYKFFEAIGKVEVNTRNTNSSGKNILDLISEIEDEDTKNVFIGMLSKTNQSKYEKRLKKKHDESVTVDINIVNNAISPSNGIKL